MATYFEVITILLELQQHNFIKTSNTPMNGENHGTLLVLRHDKHDDVPHEALCHGIHARAGLV